MQLQDYVGGQITVLIPRVHPTKLVLVKLHAVEAGGIWIESQEFANLALTALNLPSAPRTLVFFFPYHEVAYVMSSVEGMTLNETSLGV